MTEGRGVLEEGVLASVELMWSGSLIVPTEEQPMATIRITGQMSLATQWQPACRTPELFVAISRSAPPHALTGAALMRASRQPQSDIWTNLPSTTIDRIPL